MKPSEPYGRYAQIEMLLRWIVGLAFVFASLHKIAYPEDFARIVYSYNLFPPFSINLIAIVLPFMELTTGLALIAGFYPRAAAAIINALLIAFAYIITLNLLRGYDFDCGCFPTFITRLYADDPVSMLIRDVILLFCGLPVMIYGRRRRGLFFKSARAHVQIN